METMTIADAVEDLRKALEWSDEAVALGAPDYGWSDDDSHGRLVWGPVEVEWTRDMYGEGDTDWVGVSVSYHGIVMEGQDNYPELDDAVRAAARRTDDWQKYRAGELCDEIVSWLEHRGESFDVHGPQDVHEAWSIAWRETLISGYFTEDDGDFVWSVMNPESGYYLDGDADSTDDDVIEAIERCATDPMVEAFREEIEEATADDNWAVRTSDDGLTVSMSDPTYAQSRRTYYEAVGYGEGRIELEYRLGVGEWRAYDERLPEDEADVHAMAREAYEWVKAVAE